MRKTVLAFGEILWDVFPTGRQLGGAPLNFASRLGPLGDRAVFVSRVGQDEQGEQALARMNELRLDPSLIQIDEQHPTGSVEVTVDDLGNPAYHILPGAAYDFIEPHAAMLDRAQDADLIYFGTLIQRSAVSRATLSTLLDRNRNTHAFLDLNLRPNCYSPETIFDSLTRADLLKLNEVEVESLAKLSGLPARPLAQFCTAVLERWSLSCCVVTLGERGAFAAASDGSRAYAPGYALEVVDTCGSGDAFSAGFVHAWLAEAALSECCRLGCALGALVATQKGGTTPISTEELSAFMRINHRLISDPDLRSFVSS